MGDVINFNKFRRERARAEQKQKAQENRALFGQSKSQKTETSSTLDKIRKALDGSRLDGPDDKPPKRPA